MIAWGSFVVVLVASVIGACGTTILFSLGLRFATPEAAGRKGMRALGILCFVACGLLVAYGVYLIIPFFHR